MSRRSSGSVTTIGCYTDGWRKGLNFAPSVKREFQSDASLWPLLRRKMVDHDRALPRLLARGRSVVTVLWRSRQRPESAVLASVCHPSGRLITTVTYIYEGR